MLFLKRLIDVLASSLAVVSGVAIVIMMIHVTADVILRSVFNNPPVGTITFVSKYYMVFLVCLPFAFVERSNSHISVEVLSELLPKALSYHLHSWTHLLSAAVLSVVVWASWQEAITQFRMDSFVMAEDIAIPISYGYFAIPVGYGLWVLYLILKFVMYLLGTPPEPSTSVSIKKMGEKYD